MQGLHSFDLLQRNIFFQCLFWHLFYPQTTPDVLYLFSHYQLIFQEESRRYLLYKHYPCAIFFSIRWYTSATREHSFSSSSSISTLYLYLISASNDMAVRESQEENLLNSESIVIPVASPSTYCSLNSCRNFCVSII